MSLLDKKKGLAMLPALFLLFACEEPSEVGIGLNPKESEISTHYLEIPVEATQLRVDTVVSSSIVTLSQSNTGVTTASYGPVLIGKATDPTFGTLTATAYTNIGTPTSIPAINQNSGVDSLVLRLAYNQSFVGNNIAAPQRLDLYKLEDAITPTSGSVASKAQFRYLTSSQEPLGDHIGEITFDTASVSSNVIVRRLRSSEAMAIATQILNAQKADTTIFYDQQKFNEIAGGLAFVPGEDNTFINSYRIAGGSRLELYYGGNTTPITLPFIPELGEGQNLATGDVLPTYFNLEADYSNTIFESAPTGNNVEFQNPDNQVYFRAGVGLLPKFSFSGLEDFANSNPVGEIVINQAVLVIDSVSRSNLRESFPEQANFFFVEEENNKLIGGVTEPYAGAALNLTRAISETDTVYSYNGDVTEEIERLVQTGDSNYLQGIVAPGSSSTSLFNFIAEPRLIVLKIVYTVLKNQNKQDN